METITDHPINAMLADLFGYGIRQKRRTSRTKIYAVMQDGTERMVYKNRGGWNLPNGYCFTSRLDNAKQAWIESGAVKFVRR